MDVNNSRVFNFIKMNNLQDNIENLRKEKGYTQAYMAEKLHITQSSYSAYITKNTDLKFSLLAKIADILNVSVIDLITYPDVYKSINSKNDGCELCKQKDAVIKSLTEYIEVLKNQLKTK